MSERLKTNVHVPTDLRLLQDATRCLIRVRANLARTLERSRWRPHKSLREKLRKKYPSSRKGRSSEYKLSKVRTDLHFCLRMAKKARFFLDALEQTIRAKPRPSQNDPHTLQLLCDARQQICMYLDYVALFSDQIRRRIFKQEPIPSHEKVYSIFKPFTRWIVKGKPGILCELSVPVAVMEDEYQFVLGYEMIWKGTDKDAAIALVDHIEAQDPGISMTCSFDRGFYSLQAVG